MVSRTLKHVSACAATLFLAKSGMGDALCSANPGLVSAILLTRPKRMKFCCARRPSSPAGRRAPSSAGRRAPSPNHNNSNEVEAPPIIGFNTWDEEKAKQAVKKGAKKKPLLGHVSSLLGQFDEAKKAEARKDQLGQPTGGQFDDFKLCEAVRRFLAAKGMDLDFDTVARVGLALKQYKLEIHTHMKIENPRVSSFLTSKSSRIYHHQYIDDDILPRYFTNRRRRFVKELAITLRNVRVDGEATIGDLKDIISELLKDIIGEVEAHRLKIIVFGKDFADNDQRISEHDGILAEGFNRYSGYSLSRRVRYNNVRDVKVVIADENDKV